MLTEYDTGDSITHMPVFCKVTRETDGLQDQTELDLVPESQTHLVPAAPPFCPAGQGEWWP